MIVSFKHKGLKNLYEKDNAKGINPQWLNRVKIILARLDASKEPADMDLPGLGLHPLKGDLQDFWSVNVTGNWRVIFRFEDEDAHDVDLIDYH